MLSGIKLISRDQLDKEKSEDFDNSRKYQRKSSSKKEKKQRKRSLQYNSSDDEGLEKIKKSSRKKKLYSSDECSASSAGDDESDSGFEEDEKKHKSQKTKSRHQGKKKSKRSRREYASSEDYCSIDSDSHEGRNKKRNETPSSANNIDIVRKEMGLEWMLKPADRVEKNAKQIYEEPLEEPPSEERQKVNPRELNPYLRDNGSGYPEDSNQTKRSSDQLLSSSLVGDGGASWRLKALKRAQEQAAREGRNLEEVAQERWGSFGHLAVSVASHSAAAPRAHLHAIKSRKMGTTEEVKSDLKNESRKNTNEKIEREYLKDFSVRHPEMKAPKVHDSLSWGRRKGQNLHNKDAALISNALSSLNKFHNDGSFMSNFTSQHSKDEHGSDAASDSKSEGIRESESNSAVKKSSEEKLTANQLAAKAMQLRLKGKHEEADKLLKEAENTRVEQDTGNRLTKQRNDASAARYVTHDIAMRQRGKEDDTDMHLAQRIAKNKQYSISTQADDEYDYDGAPTKKSRRKGAERENKSAARHNLSNRIMTQQERCVFCFENPKRPKHLVVAIANFTYLMLPQYQPVVPGHCYILPLQHDSATRMVDDNVWEEIRNFKKCLIMMFAKQEKEMIFLETVMGLAQQRRHCLIECIPLSQDIAKEAPLYFKKAIDEAEDEWSQHNAKKLIDTSQKGLRASIPKNFPYFHVEFGLNRGFVHVIDDETQFKTSLGLNVIRGMLQSHDEDMYRRRRYESIEVQKQAVAAFAKDWEPFDWTKQLE